MKKFILLILTAIISFGYINESRAKTYVYDENGNLIKEGDGTNYYKYSYENGNKTKAEDYNCSSGTCEKSRELRYTYTDGKTKEEIFDNCSSGICTTKSYENVYTYTDGNLTKVEHYWSCFTGTCTMNVGEDVYTYTDGNLTKVEKGCSSGTCTSKSEEYRYTYTDGNMTKEEYYNCSSGTCKKSSEYRNTYTDGNMTKQESYDCSRGTCRMDSMAVFTYEFDKYGNIIKQYVYGFLNESHEYPDEYYNMKCTKAGDCTSCSGGKVLQEKACVASCGSSFRLNDGECDRIRYTPAEAAQYLKDTDNEIIMTFKVNR